MLVAWPARADSDDDAADEEHATEVASAPAPPASHVPPAPLRVEQKDGMVHLPGGTFTMGSRDPAAPANERPPHAEAVRAFWIDRTEVTVGAYRSCVATGACLAPSAKGPRCTFGASDPLFPVNCIHWSEADAYCRAVGKRLPREAEWEFAARGTQAIRYPWGGFGTSCSQADTLVSDQTGKSCTQGHPSRVATHPGGASPFGVLDLSGGVEEWTSDWYSEHAVAGAAPRSGASHVLRGGGWLTQPMFARTTTRNWGSSVEAGPNVGFRCAKDG